jgi:hypothetical protein
MLASRKRHATNALLVGQVAIQLSGFKVSYQTLLTARNYHYSQTIAKLPNC